MDNYNSVYYNQNSDEMRRLMYYQAKAKQERIEIRKLGNIFGITLFFYLTFQMLSVYALDWLGLMDAYNNSMIFQSSFTIIAVELISLCIPFGLMALFCKKKYDGPLIPSKKLSLGTLVLWVGFGMMCCVGADYIVAIISSVFESIGYTLEKPETLEPNTAFACLVSIVGTAIVPPICEEFAMRCCGVGLLKKYGKGFAVTAIALIFGLVHGNIVQFIFASLIGIILGYVTVKTNSILPAIFIHAFNNGMSCVTSILKFAIESDKAGDYAAALLFVFWLVFGAACAVVLAFKKSFKRDGKHIVEPFGNSFGKKLATFFFVPGMIVPFGFFVYSIIITVKAH